MKAMVTPRFGGPKVFELRELERPEPAADEVLVRVLYSGTNPVDAKLCRDGTWAGLEPPVVLGHDVSGIVEAVGTKVTVFKPGDEVYYTPEIFGNPMGSSAEYNVAPTAIVARKPRALSHEQAAAVPLAGGTAWEAVVRRLRVRPGETLLIHGGAGGVGSFAVQIAKAAGARVLARAGAANQHTLRGLGADVAIDYARDDFTEIVLRETEGRGADAVFDTVGGDLVARSIRATRADGRLACILTPAGGLDGLSAKNLTLFGVFLKREARRLEELSALIEQGKMRPLIDQVLPLQEVRKAHERLDTGHGRGKVVLRVGA